MDRKAMRERMRRKQRQIRRRKIIKLVTYAVAAVLAVIFVIRGIIFPVINRVTGADSSGRQEVQADPAAADPNAAVRQPLKGQGDVGKVSSLTPGWHEDENGRWYQNADGTYFAGGFQEIDGVKYSFDENGYMQTGWVTKGAADYYFNEDGSYNPDEKRPMIALTFDDGPGPYTDTLLDCLEENNAHATFFMVGKNVGSYPDTVKRMVELGCEIGSHSWDHADLSQLDAESVAKEFTDTDQALIEACGQAATVARAPYGNWNETILSIVGKPFIMWSLDSLDWDYKDAEKDYQSVMVDNSDRLSDGTIILMHDIHEPTVEAVKRIVPELIAQGYKLVTISEMAAAKGVTLQNASYTDFWQSSFDAGTIAGASGTETEDSSSEDGSSEDSSSEDGASEDGSSEDDGDSTGFEDGTEDTSEEDTGEEWYGEESDDSFDDGSGE